jgi:hypothetical protein
MVDDEKRRDRSLNVVVAEFNALRKEIADRSITSYTLLSLNITASGTVVGFVISGKADPLLLLVLPVFSPSLGMLFIDHSTTIVGIGNYINSTLRPLAQEFAPDTRILAWEQRVDEHELRARFRIFATGIPLTILFAGVPVGALVFSFTSVEEIWSWALWVAGVVLVGLFLVYWIDWQSRPFRK